MQLQEEHRNPSPVTSPEHGVRRRAPWIAATLLFAAFSFWAGFEQGNSVGPSASLTETILSSYGADLPGKEGRGDVDFDMFWKAWDLLEDKYVDKGQLDPNQMLYGAINGMLGAAGDPYTTFFDPKENKEFQEDISGSFEGIGAEIGIKGGTLTVVAPLDGTPAQQAGLRPGDKILKIDSESTVDMDVEKAVSLIRGQKGTEVSLTVFRNGGANEAQEIKVRRDTIVVKSVKLEFREDGIAYVKVSRFGEDTESLFGGAMKEVAARKSRGIVLDLRNNPGGFLDSAVSMASRMLPSGKVVVMEEDNEGKRRELKSKGGDLVSGIETVVLINEGSASASEILSGALKDNRSNVTLVGKKSFGKGSVQELIPLTRETSVKITVAKWLTPSGKQINNQGIAPDIDVALTGEDYEHDRDPQLDRSVEVLREKLGPR
jgi:carboxyl-terminal processing protease